jgi:hypothetical protein
MWDLAIGSIAFALAVSLLDDFMLPRWLTWIISGLFAYGLICWT